MLLQIESLAWYGPNEGKNAKLYLVFVLSTVEWTFTKMASDDGLQLLLYHENSKCFCTYKSYQPIVIWYGLPIISGLSSAVCLIVLSISLKLEVVM